MKSYIKFSNLSANLPNNRLLFENLNLSIKKNTLTLLLGPTGSGKTTILRIIKGIIPFLNKDIDITGKVFIGNEEKDTSTYFSQSLNIGFLFQDFDLQFIGSTVENELSFQLENFGISSSDIKMRIQYYSNKFPIIKELLNISPQSLSGGELAQVEFISTLISDPWIILLDEPFANLDSIGIKTIIKLLSELKKEKTIVISTHDFIPYLDLIDEIIVLDPMRSILHHYLSFKEFIRDIKKFKWLNVSEIAVKYYLNIFGAV